MSFRIDRNHLGIKTAPDANPYTLTKSDHIYIARSGQTLNLPDPTNIIGQVYYIKLGEPHAANVTIQCVHGLDTFNIDGAASDTITKDYGVIGVVAGVNASGNPQWFLLQHIDRNI